VGAVCWRGEARNRDLKREPERRGPFRCGTTCPRIKVSKRREESGIQSVGK
jgi:hypothetical protein